MKKLYIHNLRVPGITREEMRDGTLFLVVPVVMLQEQVLFCGNCHPDGEFISAEEIAASAPAWDNRPVTLSHPGEDFTPENHQRLEVGRVFNVRWEAGRLKGEMWLDLVKLKMTMAGREAEKRFRDGEVTEISTGYFVDRVRSSGKFEGVAFAIKQIGIMPDHLAILTEEVGACSVAGGCGAPRRNSQAESSTMDKDDATFIERITKGYRALLALGSAVGDGSDDGKDKTGGPGKTPEEGSMETKELIRKLVENKAAPFSEKELTGMTEAQVKSLAELYCECDDDKAKAEAAKKKAESEAAVKEKADAATAAKVKAEAEAKKKAEADAGKKGGPQFSEADASMLKELCELSKDGLDGLKALIKSGADEGKRRDDMKAKLIAQLSKDDKVAIPDSVLKGMALEALEGVDRSLNPLNYAGRGGPRIENTADDHMFAPDPPAIVLAPLTKEEGGDS